MSLFDWFTAHRRVTIIVVVTILILTILVSATRSSYISKWILDYFTDWSVALSAGAAVVLLYVIYVSTLKTSRMRQEDRELDFKRRSLDELLRWVRDVRRECLMTRRSIGGRYELQLGLESVAIENEWTVRTAKIFGGNFRKKVEGAAKDLKAYIAVIYDDKKANAHRDSLMLSLNKVLDAAFKLQVEHRL